MKLLIVDDNENWLFLTKFWLKETIYKVQTVKNGKDALELLHSEHFDLVLLDLSISEMKDLKIYNEIKSTYPDIIIIIMSNYVEFLNKLTNIKYCYEKPFTKNVFLKYLDDIVTYEVYNKKINKNECSH